MTNGEKLKEIRRVISQYEKCTQADFAEMVDSSLPVVGGMEIGQRPITDNFKRRIKEATGAEILDGYEYPVARDNETAPYERFTLKHYNKLKLPNDADMLLAASQATPLKTAIYLTEEMFKEAEEKGCSKPLLGLFSRNILDARVTFDLDDVLSMTPLGKDPANQD